MSSHGGPYGFSHHPSPHHSSFFSLLHLLQTLRDEQILSLGFQKDFLQLPQVHSLATSFPELLSFDPLSLDPPPTIRNHTLTHEELVPFRTVIFLQDLQNVILHQTSPLHISHLSSGLSNPMLSESDRFDLLRQFCGCIARVPPEHLSNIYQNHQQLRITGVMKELGVEENHPFFVPLLSSLFSLPEEDFLSLCASLLNMGGRYLVVLAKLFGVPHDTYLTARLLLSSSPPPSSSPSSSSSSPSPSSSPSHSLPNLKIELKDFPNTNKAFLTKRPLPHPKPSIQLSGDDTALDPRSLLVSVSLVNFFTNQIYDSEVALSNNFPLPIVSGQCINYQKLTINKTSKACDDCLFCFQFELRYYQNPSSSTPPSSSPYEILHTIRSRAFRTISHAESLPSRSSSSPSPIPPPTLFEIIPESTDDTGETKIAILGQSKKSFYIIVIIIIIIIIIAI